MTISSSYGTSPVIQFSGLASGLDTTSIINQLMQLEAIPQNALKSRMAIEQSQVSALQSVNAAFASLATAAKSFSTGSTWTQLTATSSNPAVTVTASSSAVPATVNLVVNSTAQAAQVNLTTSPTAVTTYTVLGADGVTPLTDASGNPVTFTPADTSLSALANAINASTANSNLKAVLINGTTPMLEIQSTKTGATSNFKITGADGSTLADTTMAAGTAPANVTQGADASISIDGQGFTSATNTFTAVMPGVDVTVAAGTAAATTSTLSITDDGSSRAKGIGLFVQQINSLLDTIAAQTSYGTIAPGQAPTGAGALAGNPDLRGLADQLANTLFPSDGTSMASYGLSMDKDGRFTFDQAAFTAAYQANPTKAQAAFIGTADPATGSIDGFATRVQKVATLASDPYTGTLTTTITSMKSEITSYQTQILAWDDRLAAKKISLEGIYTNLETKLSGLQAQQSWLSGQLGSLDGGWAQTHK